MAGKNYKIAFVVPYFGKLPSYFEVWKKTVLSNSTIDFYMFTDCEVESEQNLHVQKLSFEDFKKILQNQFPFSIRCEKPYKICDYKPTYGLIFQDILHKYDFWEHCDLDMCFGDLRHFITDDVLDGVDKFGSPGFLVLYRNNRKMNELFMDDGPYPEYNYKEVFSTDFSYHFDEYSGIGLKCMRNHMRTYYNPKISLNVGKGNPFFYNKEGKQVVCIWENGKLYERTADGNTSEIMLIHIEKMNVRTEGELVASLLIAPGIIKSVNQPFEKEWFSIRQKENEKCRFILKRLCAMCKNGSVFWYVKKYLRVKKQIKYGKSILPNPQPNP